MSTFKIGEIAILQNCDLVRNNGTEVEITSDLRTTQTMNPFGKISYEAGYNIVGCLGATFAITNQLRKKQPPPSHKAIAHQAMLDCINKAKQPQKVPA